MLRESIFEHQENLLGYIKVIEICLTTTPSLDLENEVSMLRDELELLIDRSEDNIPPVDYLTYFKHGLTEAFLKLGLKIEPNSDIRVFLWFSLLFSKLRDVDKELLPDFVMMDDLDYLEIINTLMEELDIIDYDEIAVAEAVDVSELFFIKVKEVLNHNKKEDKVNKFFIDNISALIGKIPKVATLPILKDIMEGELYYELEPVKDNDIFFIEASKYKSYGLLAIYALAYMYTGDTLPSVLNDRDLKLWELVGIDYNKYNEELEKIVSEV